MNINSIATSSFQIWNKLEINNKWRIVLRKLCIIWFEHKMDYLRLFLGSHISMMWMHRFLMPLLYIITTTSSGVIRSDFILVYAYFINFIMIGYMHLILTFILKLWFLLLLIKESGMSTLYDKFFCLKFGERAIFYIIVVERKVSTNLPGWCKVNYQDTFQA